MNGRWATMLRDAQFWVPVAVLVGGGGYRIHASTRRPPTSTATGTQN